MLCDVLECLKPATVNFQLTWVEYSHNHETEDYGEPKVRADIEEPTESRNLHFCEKHGEQWVHDELADVM